MSNNGVISCLRDVRPPVTNYEPSIWGDTFSNSSFDHGEQQKYIEAIEALKQEARAILMGATATAPLQQMLLIDTLERLGLAYHFETEIEQMLGKIHIHAQQDEDNVSQDYDLLTTALRFRLLRQHQHHISSDVFDKFVDEDGKFKETLSSDVEGLLSLYEAAHVLFRGEKILENAANFARHYLKRMEEELESPLKEKVKRALEHPFHRDLPIVHARVFISIYEMDPSRNELLLKLAKFNFNFLQNLYKNELSQLSRWWNKFDLKSKIAYTRDRMVEAYVWGVGFHYEPQYSYVRTGIAKAVQISGVVDDFYDNYATLSEAQLFTEVIDRWNKDEADRLPDHMKIVYDFVWSTYEDYERDAINLGKGFAAPYFKETVQQLARAYNQELKWVMERQLPSFQDYVKNSEVTSCIFILFAFAILGLKSVTQQTIDWLKTEPKLAISTAMIGRYWNDIGSHHRESKGGKMLTVIDCYMKQYGVTKQETLSKFAELVEEAWMDVNKEFVDTTTTSSLSPSVAKEAVFIFLNYARMSDATYNTNNGDAYTDPKIFKAIIPALFIHPIVT